MTKRTLNILVSSVVAALFIWLAVRNIDLSELWGLIQTVSLWWLPGFVVIVLISHLFRAERWRLLLREEARDVPRSTLFAGVMTGYFVNSVLPRIGEVARPVYVAKKQKMSSSNLLGTIVIERIVDVCSMLFLMVVASIYISRDIGMVEQLFGTEQWGLVHYLFIPALILLFLASMWGFYKLLDWIESNQKIKSPLLQKIVVSGRSFGEGMTSIRNVNRWPTFFLLTAGIWIGYIAMTFLPFYMLNLQAAFGLSVMDAVTLTLVSSIGVSIPTPGGIGSYHLLIQQAMNLLYDIPLVTALTYATVAHAASVITVLASTPIVLWWDKYNTLKVSGER